MMYEDFAAFGTQRKPVRVVLGDLDFDGRPTMRTGVHNALPDRDRGRAKFQVERVHAS